MKLNAQKLSAEIAKHLDEESINRLAKECGFICRNGGKIDGSMFLDVLLFTQVNYKKISLNELSIQLFKRYRVKIRKQSVDERFSEKAVGFFKAVFEKAINASINWDNKIDFTTYDKVRVKDSTSYQLPENMKDPYTGSGGSGSVACIRIQFEYDLKNRKILDLSLHPYTTQDMTNAKETLDDIDPNDLVMRDLGYIKIEYLRSIEDRGAFYLNRLHSGTNVYELKNGKFVEIDFAKLHKHMNIKGMVRIEKTVYVGGKEKFKTRMVIERLPDEKYKDRLRKAEESARKNKRNISANYKARIGLNIFVTNTEVPAKHIRLLYTLRWQIELMFKIWKSICEIDHVKKMKVARYESCLFVKLIWIVLNWHIMNQIIIYYFNERNIEISPYKLFNTLNNSIMEFREALKNGTGNMCSYIEETAEISFENHRSEKKKNSITWSYEVMMIFLLSQ